MENQVDISSAQNVNSPIYLIVVHQTPARLRVPNKTKNFAIFDNPYVRKYFVDIDGVTYRR